MALASPLFAMMPKLPRAHPTTVFGRHRRFALLLSLLLAGVLAGSAWAAPVSEGKARQVARNAIVQHIAIHGSWNGASDASIDSIELVVYAQMPVAWNVRVKPTGHLLVAVDDEFSPVLL